MVVKFYDWATRLADEITSIKMIIEDINEVLRLTVLNDPKSDSICLMCK